MGLETRLKLLQALQDAAGRARSLGYPHVARLLDRLAFGEPLVRVVCQGGLVRDVNGLPREIYHGAASYEVLDYDDLEDGALDEEEILHVYRQAGLTPPVDPGEALRSLPVAFAQLEWDKQGGDGRGVHRELPPGKLRRASVRVGDWHPEATFPLVLIGGECYVYLGTPPEALPDEPKLEGATQTEART